MNTQDSQSKYDDRKSLSIKIAKQIFPILHPYGVKRTRGEKNEDAHYIEQQLYHENIMKYIDAYVTTRVKEAERLARDDENSRWKIVAEEIVEKDGVYRAVNYLNKRCQEIALTTTTNGKDIRG